MWIAVDRSESKCDGSRNGPGKILKVPLRASAKGPLRAFPLKPHRLSVQGLVVENEPALLVRGQTVFDECHVEVFVTAIKLIANHGMTDVGEMNSDLMLAARKRQHVDEAEVAFGPRKPSLHEKFGPRRQTVGPNAVFYGHPAGFILAERRINGSAVCAHVTMDNSEIVLFDGAVFPETAYFAGGIIAFRNQGHSARFAVEPVDEMRHGVFAQIKTHTADQAGILVSFGGMANEAGRFINDQHLVIFVNDGEELFSGG